MFSQGYIGVSKHTQRRFIEHQKKSENPHLKNAIKKYGWDALVKTEILVAEEDYCLEIETKLRPNKSIGWNINAGGGLPPVLIGQTALIGTTPWNKGKKYGAETCKKISDAVKLAMQNPDRKEINRKLLLGKPSLAKGLKHSEETRAKMSKAKIGKPSKFKGVPATPEQIAKIVANIRAYSWICPHCQTAGYGRGAANRWHFNNCKHIGNDK
jgi:hypothetical protein